MLHGKYQSGKITTSTQTCWQIFHPKSTLKFKPRKKWSIRTTDHINTYQYNVDEFKEYSIDLPDDCTKCTPNNTAYKRCSCHHGYKLMCKFGRNLSPPYFGQAGHAGPLDGWRCSSLNWVMSRQIQVRQTHINKSGFGISAINKYTLKSRYLQDAIELNTVCTWEAQVSAKHHIQIPGPAIYTENPDSQLTQT